MNEELADGWKLSSVEDVQQHPDSVKLALDGLTWNVCGLVDGSVTGDACDYEIIDDVDSTAQYKVLVRGKELLPDFGNFSRLVG